MKKFLKLTKLNVFQTGMVFSILSFFVSLIYLVPMSIIGVFTHSIFAVFFVLASVIYGVVGFISGIIVGYVYNFVVKLTGGIEIEYEDIEKFS